MKERPVVFICGPTASGKTSLGIQVAKEFGGEIISADSRAIYKGMDIGTAKPSMEQRQGIVHWGFDLVKPGERFTVADFQKYAKDKIKDIRGRGRLPIVVGGTGLYVDAVLFDYEFPAEAAEGVRGRFEKMNYEELIYYCNNNNVTLPVNYKNKRHVINAIIRKNAYGKRKNEPIDNCIVVGITTDREILRERIRARSEQIFNERVVEEATKLGELYGWKSEAMTGNIYPLIHSYSLGEMSIDEVKSKFAVLDWRLAKRQLTWLKRNKFIHWVTLDEAYGYIAKALADE